MDVRDTVLWPDLDPLFPRDRSDAATRYSPRARVRTVDGAGHLAPLEYPGAMADAVLEMLAADPPPAAGA